MGSRKPITKKLSAGAKVSRKPAKKILARLALTKAEAVGSRRTRGKAKVAHSKRVQHSKTGIKKARKQVSAIRRRNVAGGSATGGGINFQAAVTAITMVYVARAQPLGWLEGVVDDVPAAVSAETGGAGDDIALELLDGTVVEVQVKKGLTAGDRLWQPLLRMAEATASGAIGYGVLAVCPDTSFTIRSGLAKGIRRLADGRDGSLDATTKKFCALLRSGGLNPQQVAQCLHIVTLHASARDGSDIRAAKAELAHICIQPRTTGKAWDRLYRDATQLIELRGRRTAQTVAQLLRSAGIDATGGVSKGSPVSIITALAEWASTVNSTFAVIGIGIPLPIDTAWIPISTVVREERAADEMGLSKALEQYHAWSERSRHAPGVTEIAPETIGWFLRRCVVVAGPGMGKSTLLKKLARVYAGQGLPVLSLKLPMLAARMAHSGSGFEEGLFALALDGSRVSPSQAIHASIEEWVLLGDGLDECAPHQEVICEGLNRFATSFPRCRVVVTTRPIGYHSRLLKDWRHYELLPLESSRAPDHVSRIVSAVLPEDSADRVTVMRRIERELKKNEVMKLAVRSPLLLSMIVSLGLQSVEIGKSKVEVYGRLFRLIHDAPSTRKTAQLSTAVVGRFLDILGWEIHQHPAEDLARLMYRCSVALAGETHLSPLLAKERCEQALAQWEQQGMVERLQHAGQETVTFIHRTFGEYAAARYIEALPDDRLDDVLHSCILSEDLQEVVSFAASLGKADTLVRLILRATPNGPTPRANLQRCLTIIAEGQPPPAPDVRAQVFEEALRYVTSPRRDAALVIGNALIESVPRFPDELGPSLAPLTDASQPWTKLIAWGLLVSCGPRYYSMDALIAVFRSLPSLVGPGFRSSLTGGISLSSRGHVFGKAIALEATRRILNERSEEEANALLSELLGGDFGQTVGLQIELLQLLDEHGAKNLAKKLRSPNASRDFLFPPKEYEKARQAADTQILEALAGLAEGSAEDPAASSQDRILLSLSAFMDAAGYWEASAPDVWNWQHWNDKSALTEIFRALVAAANIDPRALAHEALAMLALLEHHEGDGFFSGWWEHTVHVDTLLEWQKIKASKLSLDRLEAGLYHGSSWIVVIAANAVFHACGKDSLEPIVARALRKGQDITLFAAGALAEELNVGAKMIIERLQDDLVPGVQYLYERLMNLEVPWSDKLLAAIRKGLQYGKGLTATAAAKLADKHLSSASGPLTAALQEAYRFWQKNEDPYPTHGGAIPVSPRATIASTLVKIGAIDEDDCFSFASDVRSDVRDVGNPALLDKLMLSEEARLRFLIGIETGVLSPGLLRHALKRSVPFEQIQVNRICSLLTNRDPSIRFAAMSVLETTYMTKDHMRRLAESMSSDNEAEIRDRALAILERLAEMTGTGAG